MAIKNTTNFKVGSDYYILEDAECRSDLAELDAQVNGDIDDIKDDVQDITTYLQGDLQTALNNLTNGLNTANNKIDAIKEPINSQKNIVFFGDSWGANASTDTYKYPYLVSQYLGMNMFCYCYSGAAFLHNNGNTIEAQIEYGNSNMTTAEKNNTSIVIIYAGVNDIRNRDAYNVSLSTYASACVTCATKALSYFPNAVVWFCLSNTRAVIYTEFEHNINTTTYGYLRAIGNNRLCMCGGITNVINGDLSLFDTTYFHPSVNGHKCIAGYLANVIRGGSHDITYLAGTVTIDSDYGSRYIGGHFWRRNYMVQFEAITIWLTAEITETTAVGTMSKPLYVHRDIIKIPLYAGGAIVGTLIIQNNGDVSIRPLTTITANQYLTSMPYEYLFGKEESYVISPQ